MIYKVFPSYLPPDKLVLIRLFVVIIVYAILALAGRRGWLKPKELIWIGGAVIFWAISWLLSVLLPIVRMHYHAVGISVAISGAMILPLIAAMIVGLWFILKKVRSETE